MESRLAICVVILALVLDGGRAQLDVCGVAPLNPRIVGGSDAVAGAWPWMAGLYYSGVGLGCGGTLINDMWILTAASCANGLSSSHITVVLGRLALQGSNPNAVIKNVSQIITHPSYNPFTFDNDIALLKLSSPVKLTNYTRPACLAADGSGFSGTAWVTGWGDISNNGGSLPSPGTLRETDVPFVSNEECKKTFGTLITDNMICAGGRRKGLCAGDGGGPMVVQQDTRWIQAGVSSFVLAQGCAQPNKADGYARVSRYQSWIKRHVTANQPGFVYNSSNVISGRSNMFSLLLLCILPLVFSL